jgi:hypothetical protein
MRIFSAAMVNWPLSSVLQWTVNEGPIDPSELFRADISFEAIALQTHLWVFACDADYRFTGRC